MSKSEEKWEEEGEETIICPICMEHPHDAAVLLICSSHEKGCRPFMCDDPQSNCFDQFRKSLPPPEGSRRRRPRRLACPLCRGSIRSWRRVVEHAGSAGPTEDAEDRIASTVERLVVGPRTPENMRAIEDQIGSLEPCELEEVRFRVRLYVALGEQRAMSLWSGGSEEDHRVRRRLND